MRWKIPSPSTRRWFDRRNPRDAGEWDACQAISFYISKQKMYNILTIKEKLSEVVKFVATTHPRGQKRCRRGDACQIISSFMSIKEIWISNIRMYCHQSIKRLVVFLYPKTKVAPVQQKGGLQVGSRTGCYFYAPNTI